MRGPTDRLTFTGPGHSNSASPTNINITETAIVVLIRFLNVG